MPTKQRRLIVFAPGWGGLPPKYGNPLLERFRKGWDTVSLRYPNNGFGSIIDTAEEILPQIQALRPAYDHITWIGHSMGGLIPWMKNDHCGGPQAPEISENIDAYVSLGTPWNGSALAKFAFWSQSAKEMELVDWSNPSKHLNLTMAKYYAENWTGPKLSICGDWDFIVPNNPHLHNPWCTTQVDIPYCSHTRLIASQRAYYEIWAWLTYSVLKETGLEDGEGF